MSDKNSFSWIQKCWITSRESSSPCEEGKNRSRDTVKQNVALEIRPDQGSDAARSPQQTRRRKEVLKNRKEGKNSPFNKLMAIGSRIKKVRRPSRRPKHLPNARNERDVCKTTSDRSPVTTKFSQTNCLPMESPCVKQLSSYRQVIRDLLRAEKDNCCVAKSKIEQQKDIDMDVRAHFIAWMFETHLELGIPMAIFFHAVTIVDSYLSVQTLKRNEVKLVCETAMRIACEENSFEFSSPSQINFRNKANADVLIIELGIRTNLMIGLNYPTSMSFVPYLIRACDVSVGTTDSLHQHLADYILCMTLFRMEALNFKPSEVASAAVNLSSKLLHRGLQWNIYMPTLIDGLRECDLEQCETFLTTLIKSNLKTDPESKLGCVKRFFSMPKFQNVSNLVCSFND